MPYQDDPASMIRRQAALKRLAGREDLITERNLAGERAAMSRRRINTNDGGYVVVDQGSPSAALTADERAHYAAMPGTQRTQGSPISYQLPGQEAQTFTPPSRAQEFSAADVAKYRDDSAYNVGEARRQGETTFNVDQAIRGDVGSSGGQLNLAKAGAVGTNSQIAQNEDARTGTAFDIGLPTARARAENEVAKAKLGGRVIGDLGASMDGPAPATDLGGASVGAAAGAGASTAPTGGSDPRTRAALTMLAALQGGEIPDFDARDYANKERDFKLKQMEREAANAEMKPVLDLLPTLAAKNPKMAAAVAKSLPMFQKYNIDPEQVFSEDAAQALTAPAVQSAVTSAQSTIKRLVEEGKQGISNIPFIRLIQRQDFPLNPQEKKSILMAHAGVVNSLTNRGVPPEVAEQEATRIIEESAGMGAAESGDYGTNMADMIKTEARTSAVQ